MPAGDELVLDSRLEEIRKLGPWLARALPQAADDPAVAVLELVLVELVSNAIRHGHANEPGHAIGLRLELLDSRRIRVQIRDRGKPIPAEILDRHTHPLEFAVDDVGTLPESGLGLAMVQAAVDRFEYRTGPDADNVTVVEKTLEGPQGP
jgi:anti-sigma regulatory factor (Ser/Thr protein kinase)